MDTAETGRCSSNNRLGLIRSIGNIVRLGRGKRSVKSSVAVATTGNLEKHPDNFDGSTLYSSELKEEERVGGGEKSDEKDQMGSKEAVEALLAGVFTGVSAIKASYVQLQIAQTPYDPETIQTADRAVVTELKNISRLKHAYLSKNYVDIGYAGHHLHQESRMAAEIQEQKHLATTFQITSKKLGNEAEQKEKEIARLENELREMMKKNSSLRSQFTHTHSDASDAISILSLEDLHISGLNHTHFLSILRYAVKSIKTFVNTMIHMMEASGWNLVEAAAAIEPDMHCGNPDHRTFIFQSYVSRIMFSDFQTPNFGLSNSNNGKSNSSSSPPSPAAALDRQRFFDDFVALKSLKPSETIDENFKNFHKGKFGAMVHAKMLSSFTNDGPISPDFLSSFAEMTRRVWLLQRLFFSFKPEVNAKIFHVRKGSRYSEVYMEWVDTTPEETGGAVPSVGFTVVPGFEIQRTVIKSMVYPLRKDQRT